MTEGMQWSIRFLADWGLSARAIARRKLHCKCRVKDGTCSHMSAVYRVTRKAGIRMFDYRDGLNLNAKTVGTWAKKKKRAG